MYGVIVTAHSEYARGLNTALKLVAGEMENLRVVNYLESQSYQDLDKNLKKEYESLKNNGYNKIIFIADLLGGTPFSRSVLNFSQDSNIRVLSGMNFPLVYTALISEPSTDMDKDIEDIIAAGRDGIAVYKLERDKNTDQESDGI